MQTVVLKGLLMFQMWRTCQTDWWIHWTTGGCLKGLKNCKDWFKTGVVLTMILTTFSARICWFTDSHYNFQLSGILMFRENTHLLSQYWSWLSLFCDSKNMLSMSSFNKKKHLEWLSKVFKSKWHHKSLATNNRSTQYSHNCTHA